MAIISINKSQIYINKSSILINEATPSLLPIDLSFPITDNWSEVSSNIWGPTTFPFPSGSADGKTNMYIPENEDGYVQFDIDLTTPTTFVALDLMANNPTTPNYYGQAEYNLYVGVSNHYQYSYIGATNGYSDSGITAETGDIVRLRRTGNTVYGEYFRNGIWNLIYQWSQTTTAQLWIVGTAANNGFLKNPKGYNVSGVNRLLIDLGGDLSSVPSKTPISNPDSNGNYWNKMVATGTYSGSGPAVNGFYNGLTVSSMFNINNQTLGLSFEIVEIPFETYLFAGSTPGLNGNGTTTSVGDYIGQATRDSFFSYSLDTSGSGQIKFDNLDITKHYSFKFWGSRISGTYDNRFLEMKKSTDSWTNSLKYNTSENTEYNNGIVFTGIKNTTNVSFDMRSDTSSTFGYIGLIDMYVDDTPDLTLVKYKSQSASFSTNIVTITGVTAGNLLVLTLTNTDDSASTPTISVSPSLDLTLKTQASDTNSGNARIYTAVAPSSTDYEFTISWSQNNLQGAVIYEISGYDANLNGSTNSSTSQSVPSLSLTTNKNNSIIIGVSSDWNGTNGSTRRYLDTSTVETLYFYTSGWYTGYHYYKQAFMTGSYTQGLVSPTGGSYGTCLFEVTRA